MRNEAFLYDAWYQAAWSDELADGAMLARTMLDIPVVVLRGGNGEVWAMVDRCPHRFAPLSRGRMDGNRVACGYHGLTFDMQGRCVHNPHGPITDRARVRAFPAIERHGRIWLWFGDVEAADPGLVPDMGFLDVLPATAIAHDYMAVRSNWLLVVDNLLDLTHSDYVHPAFGDFVTGSDMSVVDKGDGVKARWLAKGVETPHIYQSKVHSETCDIWLEADLLMPSNIVVGTGAMEPGGEPQWAQWSIHHLTPETATTSHYFFAFARDFDTANAEFTAMLKTIGTGAFVNEDKPILEAQQERIGDKSLFALNPLVLPSDKAAVLARRKLQRLMQSQEVAETAPPVMA